MIVGGCKFRNLIKGAGEQQENNEGCRESQRLIFMEARRGGSSTPSYKDVVTSRGKKPLENDSSTEEERRGIPNEKIGGTRTKKKKDAKDKEEEDKIQEAKDKKQKGPCKPKAEISPKVVLNDLALRAHRDHMRTYAIICKFMGLWPTEKALQTWIKYH